MLKLSREIRFALVPPEKIPPLPAVNSWSGWPSTNLVVPQLVLRCVLRGEPAAQSGYLCDIKSLDELLRRIVTEQLIPDYYRTGEPPTATDLLVKVFSTAVDDWRSTGKTSGEIDSIELALTPFLFFKIHSREPTMVQLTQQFEFSAAHRLHCAELSDPENRDLFGKCNNPAGHGHNYVVEVTVAMPNSETNFELATIESTVKRIVIDRLDHKHLNHDVELFAATNPTVENISVAIFNWLDGQFGSAQLKKIRLYETPKTWAEYAGR